MDCTLTLVLIGTSAAIFALSAWQSSRPRRDLMRARIIPWRFLVLVSFVPFLYGLVHLINLMGWTTGR